VVTVWVIPPLFIQVIVVPTVMVLTFATKPQFPGFVQKLPFQITTLGPLGAAGGVRDWLRALMARLSPATESSMSSED